MTIGLQITDGTTTIDLNDGSYFEIMDLDLGYTGISAMEVCRFGSVIRQWHEGANPGRVSRSSETYCKRRLSTKGQVRAGLCIPAWTR